jgi:hypothetical protein
MTPQATKLIEECSEVIHALCKIERFGTDAYNPDTGVRNIDHLRNELDDLADAINEYTSAHHIWDGQE